MPSSNPETIPLAINLLWELAPRRVLDVGAGYGKYGVLFREYLELRHGGEGIDQNKNETIWRKRLVLIDAVEVFPDYIGDIHNAVYDNIYIANIVDHLKKEWEYDVIYMGDVLEHIDKTIAVREVLPKLLTRATMGVLIITPVNFERQGPRFGNALEIHRSFWTASDFKAIAHFTHVGLRGSQLVAFLTNKAKYYAIARGSRLRRKLRGFRRALTDSW